MQTQIFNLGGVELEAIVGDHCTRPLLADCWYEQRLLNYVKSLELGGTYVDVGAFIGNHSSFFARNTKASRVVAIEGNPQILPLLQRNATRNGFGVVHAVIEGASHNSYSFSTTVATNLGMSKPSEGGDLAGTTLETQLRAIDNVTLIKIDIEGSTPDVLREPKMLAWFKTHKPELIIEARTEEEEQAISAILKPFGYVRITKSLASSPTYHWSVQR